MISVPQPRPCAPISLLGLDNLTGPLVVGLVFAIAGIVGLILLTQAARNRDDIPIAPFVPAVAAVGLGAFLILLSFSRTC